MLLVVRWILPLALIALAVVLFALGGSTNAGAGVAFLMVALCVVIFNVLLRLSIQGRADRDREEAARRYYDEHGHWPDEA